ncbi:MAG: hypothetical protein GY936_12835 [Ignavibacteriae bacterium]|nr:hypothetical protein [Ignavibacteriota bacterium]
METTKQIYCKNREEWHKWLSKNHLVEKEIWLVYYKKHTKKPRVPYNDAVEEALCFGWIDSIVKRIDNERYCQRFTPRSKNSSWSESNKERVRKLIKEKCITKFGMEIIKAAQGNGNWDEVIDSKKDFQIPHEFSNILSNNIKAKLNFTSLSPTYKKQYINWIASAKKSATRIKRSEIAIKILEENKKLGIK